MTEDSAFHQCERCAQLYLRSEFPTDPKDPGRALDLCCECVDYLAKRFRNQREPPARRKPRRTSADAGHLAEEYDEIIASLGELDELRGYDDRPCVFFALRQNEVHFVGQTKHLLLAVHRLISDIGLSDRVRYLPVPEEHLDRVHRAFVKWLRPIDNTQRYMFYRLNEHEKRLILSVPLGSPVANVWDLLDSRRRVDWT